MAHNKNLNTPHGHKSVLQQLAPTYLVGVLLLYGSFFIYWRHAKNFGLAVNWPLWIACTVVLFLVPLGLVLNRRIEQNSSPRTIAKLALYRRLVGLVFLVSPAIILTMTDLNHSLGTYYVGHGLEQDVYKSDGFISADQMTLLIPYLLSLIGLFLIFLGRSPLTSKPAFVKFILALLLALPFTYAYLLYGWAAWDS